MAISEVDTSQAASTAAEVSRTARPSARPVQERPARPVPPKPAVGVEEQRPEDPATEQIRHALKDSELSVGFFQVEGASSPVLRIYNRDTGEVIRQIPEEDVLRLRERFSELLGVMADKKA